MLVSADFAKSRFRNHHSFHPIGLAMKVQKDLSYMDKRGSFIH